MAMSGARKTALIIAGILGVLLLVGIIGIAMIWLAFRKSEPTLRNNSVLALRVSCTLPDYSPDDPFKKILGGPDQSLTGLVMQFKKAKVDNRIKAVLLDINMSGVGWGKAEAIRDAITDFRSSGKRAIEYIAFGLTSEDSISTACDRFFSSTTGASFVAAPAAVVLLFRASRDNLGIYASIDEIGKYRSAGDMFTQNEVIA